MVSSLLEADQRIAAAIGETVIVQQQTARLAEARLESDNLLLDAQAWELGTGRER